MRLGPVAQAAVSVDVAKRADIDQAAAPRQGESLRLGQVAKRVGTGRKHGAVKRQLLEWNHPAREHLGNIFARGVWRGNQHRRFNQRRVARMLCPSCHG